MTRSSPDDTIDSTIEDYKRSKELVHETGYDDVNFFMLLLAYNRLTPEEQLAKGLARGRRRYFLIRS